MNYDSPTIVLVHGALTDASVWSAVIEQLQRHGYAVVAPPLPMRSLSGDATYLGSYLATVDGPVILVGHSYAGAVITQVADPGGKIRALVYIAAFQPDSGETAGELNGRFPGSLLTPENLFFVPYAGDTDIYLKPERFKEVYAGDVADGTIAIMAATQRPVTAAALAEPLQGQPAWKIIPSWAFISTEDFSIPTAALRFMAERAGSRTIEVSSSHAAPISHPQEVAALIASAASA